MHCNMCTHLKLKEQMAGPSDNFFFTPYLRSLQLLLDVLLSSSLSSRCFNQPVNALMTCYSNSKCFLYHSHLMSVAPCFSVLLFFFSFFSLNLLSVSCMIQYLVPIYQVITNVNVIVNASLVKRYLHHTLIANRGNNNRGIHAPQQKCETP